MGMPNIPEIENKIKISRKQAINLLLVSIGMEELSLAHILNAKGEELQCVLEKCGCKEGDCKEGAKMPPKPHPKCDIDELLKVNKSINETIKNSIKKEMLLQFKLENIMELCEKCNDEDDEDDEDENDC